MQAGAKTDKIDARTLAKAARMGRRGSCAAGSRLAQLVRQRTRAKNQVHATLIRNLKGKPVWCGNPVHAARWY
jgi:transposase